MIRGGRQAPKDERETEEKARNVDERLQVVFGRCDLRFLGFPVTVIVVLVSSFIESPPASFCFIHKLESCVTTLHAKPNAASGVQSKYETSKKAPAQEPPINTNKCRIREASTVTFICLSLFSVVMVV
jgi:hypothetical protein